jgi:hypothetical protein
MGYDLYGLNPYNPNNAVKPKALDWEVKHTEKEKKKYFDALDKYEAEVVGSYFRNNVWFWRPLWHFVCMNCSDILSEKNMIGGSWNDGHKISKTKATRIGKRLKKLLRDGTAKDYEKLNNAEFDSDGNKQEVDYPFYTDNLEEFAEFCINSGGFLIY